MRYTVKKVEDDELYFEINRVEVPSGGCYMKIFRKYKNQEPEIKLDCFLLEHELDNFILGLQKARYFQKELCPLETDPSKNYGQH
jgi:hypothetical protein